LHKKRKIINIIKLHTKKGTEKSVLLKKLPEVYRKRVKSKKILTLFFSLSVTMNDYNQLIRCCMSHSSIRLNLPGLFPQTFLISGKFFAKASRKIRSFGINAP